MNSNSMANNANAHLEKLSKTAILFIFVLIASHLYLNTHHFYMKMHKSFKPLSFGRGAPANLKLCRPGQVTPGPRGLGGQIFIPNVYSSKRRLEDSSYLN